MSCITVEKRPNGWGVIYEGLCYTIHPTEAEAISQSETLNEVYKMLNELQVFVDQNIRNRFDDATFTLFKMQFDLNHVLD